MKKLYVLAPSDRFNYGDMLFPYIVRENFSAYFDELVFCAIVKSDLSEYGGIPTEGQSSIFSANSNDDNYLIVAGGDCIGISWPMIISFIDKKINLLSALFYHYNFGKLSNKLINAYIRLHYHSHSSFPFCIGKSELPNFNKVFYNSLGASCLVDDQSLQGNQSFVELLQSVDYIAVRDNIGVSVLNSMNIHCNIVADSAIVMSDIFSRSFLLKNSKCYCPYAEKQYIFFQICANVAKKHVEEYADIINRIYGSTGYHFIFCPIGTAYGHDDQYGLSMIANRLDSGIYTIVEKPSVWDIMLLINNSRLYVGTSLHGAITAMSYGVPLVGYEVKKLKEYIYSWSNSGADLFCSYDKLENHIYNQLERPVVIDSNAQKQSVYRSFEKMKTMIY